MSNQHFAIEKPSVAWVGETILEERIESSFYKAPDMKIVKKVAEFQPNVNLGSLCELVTDGTHQTPEYVKRGYGVRFLTAKNVNEDGIDFRTDNDISFEQHRQLINKRPNSGNLIITKIGKIGIAKVYPSEAKEANIFVSLALLRLKKDSVDPHYLEIFLNSRYGAVQSRRLTKGITQPDLHLNDIKKILIPLPKPLIQQYIGNKVRKAEELRKEAKKLRIKSEDKLDQVIGFKLLMNNKKDESLFNWVNPRYICTNRIDADYFRAEYLAVERLFIENKDFFQKLNHIAKLSKSRANLGDYDSFLYLDISSLNEETGIFNKKEVHISEAPSRAQKRVQINNVLVSTVRPNRKGIGLVTKDFDGQIASTGFAVLSTKDFETDPYFLYLLLGTDLVTKQLIRITSGGLYPAIGEDKIMNVFIPIVDKKSQKDIGVCMKTYFENLIEAKQLFVEAKQDVEDLIEGKFDESKISEGV